MRERTITTIQKVSDQLEVSKPNPQMVVTSQQASEA
jgi:hypothetical protein